jgi:DNA-binding CsgD family transcriptional regulator
MSGEARTGSLEPIAEGDLDSLIRLLYLAAADPSRWQAALESLQARLDAASVAITFIDTRQPHAFVQAIVGMTPAAVRLYHERYAAEDPFIIFAKEHDLFRTGLLGLVQDYLPDEAFAGTEFWEAFAKPNGYIGGLWMTLFAEGPMLAILAANRKPGRYFGAPEVQLLTRLRPHLETAMKIAHGVTVATERGRAALATLNGIRTPTFVCDPFGRCVFQNAAAAECPLVVVREGRLAVQFGSGERLQRAIAAMANAFAPSEDMQIALTDAAGERVPAIVSTVPQDGLLPLGPPLAAVMILARGSSIAGIVPTLPAVYGFTPAEAAVAGRLLAGDTVTAAARHLEIAPATARVHLRSMFRKTGVHRQAALIRTVLTSVVE